MKEPCTASSPRREPAKTRNPWARAASLLWEDTSSYNNMDCYLRTCNKSSPTCQRLALKKTAAWIWPPPPSVGLYSNQSNSHFGTWTFPSTTVIPLPLPRGCPPQQSKTVILQKGARKKNVSTRNGFKIFDTVMSANVCSSYSFLSFWS